jgi:hypothetical protein
MKNLFGKKRRRKNTDLAIAQKQDPERFRERTVLPEKGRGKKDRPREPVEQDFDFDSLEEWLH